MPDAPKKTVFVEPADAPTIVVNRIIPGGYWGSQFILLLGTNTFGVNADGDLEPRCVLGARLRFDLDMAKQIRDSLNEHIAVLTNTPPKDKAN